MVNEPYRELFVWALLFGRMKLAMIFWKHCPDQIGSALVASLMYKSLAREAEFAGYLRLAEKLTVNAGLVITFCCCLRNVSTWKSVHNCMMLKSQVQCFNETYFAVFAAPHQGGPGAVAEMLGPDKPVKDVFCISVQIFISQERPFSLVRLSEKKNGWWGDPFYQKFVVKSDRVGTKSPIFSRWSLVAPQP